MTIRRGSDWGVEVPRPGDLHVVASDAALARALSSGSPGPLALAAGDLHRTLGVPDPRRDRLRRVELDVLHVELDDVERLAVAHVLARRPGWRGWWSGPIVAVLNAAHYRHWEAAPRGHPNDGRAEIVEVDARMPVRARVQARRRLRTGTHLPHPSISVSSRREATWEFERPTLVELDGVRHGLVRRLRVTVEPDAFELHT